jgi:class 3 adenylate cyclase
VATLADVTEGVDSYLAGSYEVTNPRDVPDPEDVPLGKKAMEFEATALFIDVRQSTDITDSFRRQTAAKMMKAYFSGAVRIINDNGGKVRSFNGDGMLAFFTGGTRTSPAVKSAMQIDWFVSELLQPKFRKYFENNLSALGKALNFEIGCGIDDGEIYAVKVGIKGTNDVAWVARATNTAAKLSSVGSGTKNIYITGIAYDRLHDWAKIGSDGANMWSDMTFMDIGGVSRGVRSTAYRWSLK